MERLPIEYDGAEYIWKGFAPVDTFNVGDLIGLGSGPGARDGHPPVQLVVVSEARNGEWYLRFRQENGDETDWIGLPTASDNRWVLGTYIIEEAPSL